MPHFQENLIKWVQTHCEHPWGLPGIEFQAYFLGNSLTEPEGWNIKDDHNPFLNLHLQKLLLPSKAIEKPSFPETSPFIYQRYETQYMPS